LFGSGLPEQGQRPKAKISTSDKLARRRNLIRVLVTQENQKITRDA